MKKLFFILFVISGLFGSERLNFLADPVKAIEIAKSQNKKVVMFVYSTQCGWCAKMKDVTFKDLKLVKLLNEKYIFSPVNQDSGILPQNLIPEFVPMTYIIDAKSKKITHSIAGFKTADDFINELPK